MRKSTVVASLGEVVAAETSQFTAQCPRALLYQPPIFGALVRVLPGSGRTETPTTSSALDDVDDPFADTPHSVAGLPAGIPNETLYAVVYSAVTGSSEPGRRPTAYGLDEEQLRLEQPQIFDLLATEYSALHVGCARNGRFHVGIPPRPARLHAAVSECSEEEIRALTDSPDLLRTLINSAACAHVDELILACIRQGFACRGDDYAYLVRTGKQLANLLRDDPDRLAALLRRLAP